MKTTGNQVADDALAAARSQLKDERESEQLALAMKSARSAQRDKDSPPEPRLRKSDGHRSSSFGVLFDEDVRQTRSTREPGSLFDSYASPRRRRRRASR